MAFSTIISRGATRGINCYGLVLFGFAGQHDAQPVSVFSGLEPADNLAGSQINLGNCIRAGFRDKEIFTIR